MTIFLRQDGTYEEVTATAVKRVLARQIAKEMTDQRISKAAMAKRMHTSRAALDRLLDPESDSVTLNTLFKAATAVGRQIIWNWFDALRFGISPRHCCSPLR